MGMISPEVSVRCALVYTYVTRCPQHCQQCVCQDEEQTVEEVSL